jgi:hypothetical protein
LAFEKGGRGCWGREKGVNKINEERTPLLVPILLLSPFLRSKFKIINDDQGPHRRFEKFAVNEDAADGGDKV